MEDSNEGSSSNRESTSSVFVFNGFVLPLGEEEGEGSSHEGTGKILLPPRGSTRSSSFCATRGAVLLTCIEEEDDADDADDADVVGEVTGLLTWGRTPLPSVCAMRDVLLVLAAGGGMCVG